MSEWMGGWVGVQQQHLRWVSLSNPPPPPFRWSSRALSSADRLHSCRPPHRTQHHRHHRSARPQGPPRARASGCRRFKANGSVRRYKKHEKATAVSMVYEDIGEYQQLPDDRSAPALAPVPVPPRPQGHDDVPCAVPRPAPLPFVAFPRLLWRWGRARALPSVPRVGHEPFFHDARARTHAPTRSRSHGRSLACSRVRRPFFVRVQCTFYTDGLTCMFSRDCNGTTGVPCPSAVPLAPGREARVVLGVRPMGPGGGRV